MDEWVRRWLEEQRRRGVKCLEVKKVGNNYYVYRSTTYWDKKAKKRRKKSEYIGKLKPEGLVEKKEKKVTVKQYGNALLLQHAMKDLIPLLKVFDSWKEIYALALTRVMGYTPLKRVKTVWEKLYMDIDPNLNPKKLSSVLKEVGLNRDAQNAVFKALMNDKHFVYDLSVVFTRSSINLAEMGYNKDRIHVPQINLALLHSAKGLPAMIRALPGSVRDITSLYNTVEEIKSTFDSELILVLDRGFFSQEAIDFLLDKDISFVIPARRNSKLYEVEIDLNEHFFYRNRLIKAGKAKKKCYLYMFEDVTLRAEEEVNLYRMLDEGRISKGELNRRLERAGKILLVSDMDVKPEEIFLMYKQRCSVEKAFDAYKNLLHADRMYLQSDEAVFGHIFVSFLALYGYCKLQLMLRNAGLLDKISPMDLLEEFSKVYMVKIGDKEIMSEVPKKVRELDEKLGLNLFPK
jgi:transposase